MRASTQPDGRKRIAIAAPVLTDLETRYVTECLATNWISSKGKFIGEFERLFADYIGAKYALAVSSGTAALHLSLVACGVRAGHEVILPAFTMIACANAVTYQSARPVLVDSDPEFWQISPNDVGGRISEKTRAIMPVHMYGHPADIDSLKETVKNREGKIFIVEDAAEAHGAMYKGTKVGCLGDVSAFSFYANKIITTGEGGMVVTDDRLIAERVASLRDQGYDYGKRKYLVHTSVGYNYRMTNLQAAVGVAQMARIDEFVGHHRKIAELYTQRLHGIPGLVLPREAEWARSVYWMFTALIDEDEFGMSRDALIEKLGELGIETRAAFLPIHLQLPYSGQFNLERFPVAESLGRRGLNLPSGNNVSSEDVESVCQAIREAREA